MGERETSKVILKCFLEMKEWEGRVAEWGMEKPTYQACFCVHSLFFCVVYPVVWLISEMIVIEILWCRFSSVKTHISGHARLRHTRTHTTVLHHTHTRTRPPHAPSRSLQRALVHLTYCFLNPPQLHSYACSFSSKHHVCLAFNRKKPKKSVDNQV